MTNELVQAPKPGTFLKDAGGLPPVRSFSLEAAKPFQPVSVSTGTNLLPSLAEILRPQSAGNWLMPYLGSITPQYIEAVLRGALAGNHLQAYQLFDLMWDTSPEISACIGEWVDGVLAKKVVIEPYCEENEEPSPESIEKATVVSMALRGMRPDAASDENDLRGTIKDLLASRFHGQSLLEVDWYDTYGTGALNLKQIPGGKDKVVVPRATYWVNPSCYAYDRFGRIGLAAPQGDLRQLTQKAKQNKLPQTFLSTVVDQPYNRADLAPLPPNKFLLSINKAKTGSPLQASALRPLAWWWLASTFCGDYLMKSAELFGIPFRVGKYGAGVNESQKAEIRQMLQSLGSAGWALLPEGASVEFESVTGQGGQSPQAFLFNLADQQIRKVILHQTMTGGSHDSMGKGGGKAFGDVEQGKVDQCINSGATHVEGILNLQLIPAILTVNYGEGGDLEAPVLTLQDQKVGGLIDAQRDQILVQFMDVGEDTMRRKYQLPKPKDGEKLCGQDTGALPAQQDADRDAKVQQAKHSANAAAAMAKAKGEGDQSNSELQDDATNKAAQQPNSDVEASYARQLEAEEAGHTFHGNQYTDFTTQSKEELHKHRSGVEQRAIDRNGKGYAKKLFQWADDKFPAPNVAEYRTNGVVTKEGEKYVLHAPANTSEKAEKWRHYDIDVTDQFKAKPTEAGRALESASATAAPLATALHEIVEPMLDRLAAIQKVTDKVVKAKMLKKFLKDHSSMAAAMQHDTTLSKELTTQAVVKFVKGLSKKPVK